MKYYVYIIYSEKFDKYYRGYTSNPEKRLEEHNSGLTRYSSKYKPWKLVYLEEYGTKKEALIREKKLKKYSKAQIKKIITTPMNKL